MSDFFRNLNKTINTDGNIFLADDASSSAEFAGNIDTGSYILNAAFSGSLYGGVPNNKITTFAGESATGKTFFVLGLVKKFLDDNPTGGVYYFDTEAAVTKEMMRKRGVDTERVTIAETISIQEFRTLALRILDNYIGLDDRPPMLLVLDSLGQLSSSKELEDSTDGKETRDMTKAQLLKATFRVLNLKLAKARVPLLITNHVYDVVGAYIPTKEMSGGSGLKYASSQICYLSKRKEKDGTEVIGNQIRVKMHKSRLTKENKEVIVMLSYKTGLDRYFGLLELAEKYGIFKKVSTRIELPDGTKTFGKTINSNPEKFYTPEIMDKLEVAARKEFLYGEEDETDEEEVLESV